ncbi:transport protein particle component [Daldinia caldariorum]|uniref:transport protein particle component n=1 Tax=Daldinia caldariorum TaxID=326644 RepID=UPI00200846BA|nr:transport protein particle component [Daldinia caldariorum]KAI1467205.1 transport protein particle component [Daldinia caldariorum]
MSSFDQPLPPFNASDPTASFLSTSCLDFLMIELVPMAYRVANELDAPEAGESGGGSGDAGTGGTGAHAKLDEDEERDAVFFRLDGLGYRVGLGLVERFSRDRPRFNDTLDAIKFVCKDLWMLVFKKQVDNLKTNHRGVYVLTDNLFRPLSRMSADPAGHAVVRAQPFLWFPCGIIRGALAAMGIAATVQAETSELPGAVFQIKTAPVKQ